MANRRGTDHGSYLLAPNKSDGASKSYTEPTKLGGSGALCFVLNVEPTLLGEILFENWLPHVGQTQTEPMPSKPRSYTKAS